MEHRNVILCGDVREQLRTLPEESVHMVVTSPPYWSLRDYKVDGTVWGGDEACEHSWTGTPAREAFAGQRRWQHGEPSGQGHAVLRSEEADTWGTVEQGAFCAFCGAWRGAFGLEPTPDLYVEHMTDIFREIRRVLRKDGTCWLNLGSSYFGSWGNYGGQNRGSGQQREITNGSQVHQPSYDGLESWRPPTAGKRRGSGGRSGQAGDVDPRREPAYGSDDTGLGNSLDLGAAYRGLCDECLADFRSHLHRSAGIDQPPAQSSSQIEPTGRDSEHQDSDQAAADVGPLGAQASTTLESWLQRRGECFRCDRRAASLSVLDSDGLELPASAHTTAYSAGRVPTLQPLADRIEDKAPSGMAWEHYTSTLKPKDVVPIPWMVAMALQADGWWLRSDIIWSKPNPMPESVGDRPTHAHEYLFLLAKSARYYYDADAIRERYSPATLLRVSQATFDSQTGGPKDYAKTGAGVHSTRHALENLKQNMVGSRRYAGFNDRWDAAEDAQDIPSGRNKRSVWEVDEDEYAQFMQWKALMSGDRRDVWSIATRPFAEAHFATYAPDLIKPCILAGTSEYGVCAECGAPWERVTERTLAPDDSGRGSRFDLGKTGARDGGERTQTGERFRSATTGWRATCKHHQPSAGFERSIVLDPFMGSGTTALVALRSGRDYIGIDLNAEYIEMAERRLATLKNQGTLFSNPLASTAIS